MPRRGPPRAGRAQARSQSEAPARRNPAARGKPADRPRPEVVDSDDDIVVAISDDEDVRGWGAGAPRAQGKALAITRREDAGGGSSMVRASAADKKSPAFEAAREKEWGSFLKNDVLDPRAVSFDDAKNLSVVPMMYVETWKASEDVTVGRKAKSRLVAIGSASRDARLIETYAGTPSVESQRILQVFGACQGWRQGFVDVRTAFLQAPAGPEEGRVAVRLPGVLPANARAAGLRPGGVYRLRRALYGLKNAPLLFAKFLRKQLEALSWRRAAESVYVKAPRQRETRLLVDESDLTEWRPRALGVTAALLHHVDDCSALAGDPVGLIKELGAKVELGEPLLLTDGESRRLVGIEVQWSGDRVVHHQSSYLQGVGVSINGYVAPRRQLGNADFARPADGEGVEKASGEYREALGAVGWLTRCDPLLSYPFSQLGRWSGAPGKKNIEALLSIVERVRRAPARLVFEPVAALEVRVWCDASFEREVKEGRAGWLIQLADASWGLEDTRNRVAWGTKRAGVKIESTTAAELVANVRAWKVTASLLPLIGDLWGAVPIRLLVDNDAHARQLRTGACGADASMQGNLDWLRQEMGRHGVKVQWVPSHAQQADGLTKWLG